MAGIVITGRGPSCSARKRHCESSGCPHPFRRPCGPTTHRYFSPIVDRHSASVDASQRTWALVQGLTCMYTHRETSPGPTFTVKKVHLRLPSPDFTALWTDRPPSHAPRSRQSQCQWSRQPVRDLAQGLACMYTHRGTFAWSIFHRLVSASQAAINRLPGPVHQPPTVACPP